MKIQSLFIVSLFSIFCTVAYAEQATGLCKDGTEYTGTSKRGACRGHKGLKEWYGDKAAATPAPAASAPAATPAAAPGTSVSGTATGLCKDGTLYTGSSKRGACRGHKGLQEWYADKQNAPATAPVPAAAPTAAPSASSSGAATGLCKDGTLYTGASKRGACRGHKGLQEWYADKQAAPATAPAPAATPVAAAPAASANSAATGLCKDGTLYTGANKRGACRGHKGLQEWYADKATAPAAAAPAAVPAPATAAPAPSPAAQPAPAAIPAQAAAPAAGGAPGQVWVNTKSKIYHCQGSRFYGRTREGEYMTEAQAQAQGYNPNRKKTCGINQ